MIPPVDPAAVEQVAALLDYNGATGGVADRDVAAMLRALSAALTEAQAKLIEREQIEEQRVEILNQTVTALEKSDAALTTAQEERDAALDFISREGYRRCDAAACNCNGWHGGHAMARLTEIGDALRDADQRRNGPTILTDVRHVLAQLAEARQHLGTALGIATDADYIDSDAAKELDAARAYHKAHQLKRTP